jgi:pyruvate,water dikinase
MTSAQLIIWLADINAESEHFGSFIKQNAELTQAKLPLVPGFVITTNTYRNFLLENNLEHKIGQLLSTVSFERPDSLMQVEFHIRQLFQEALLSDDIYDLLTDFYYRLGDTVTIEMHETGKNGRKHAKKVVTSEAGLISEVITLWSGMFTGSALWYRHHGNADHFDNKAEILVRKKITGDTKEGVVFTIDPDSHTKDRLVIITMAPHELDTYVLSKKNLTILDRTLKYKHTAEKLTLDEIFAVAKVAKRMEKHLYFPQKVTWVLQDNKLYIESFSPITEMPKTNKTNKPKLPVARGKGLTHTIGTGVVLVVPAQTYLPSKVQHHIIVMTDITSPQIINLKKVKGLIIENHPHNETVALIRQQGIPAVCNVKGATRRFRNGSVISIHGKKGEIYEGGFL